MKFIVAFALLIFIANNLNAEARIIYIQSNIDELLRSVNAQFKKNCVGPSGARSVKRVDLQGTDLLIYDSDGSKQVFDLMKTKITSEYNSGKYLLVFTCTHDCESYYDEKGRLNLTRSVGYFFNSFENATLTRNTIRKIITVVNS